MATRLKINRIVITYYRHTSIVMEVELSHKLNGVMHGNSISMHIYATKCKVIHFG